MKRENRRRIFLITYIILFVSVIVHFIIYMINRDNPNLPWKYFLLESLKTYVELIIGALAVLFVLLIINLIIYNNEESKYSGDSIYRNLLHRKKSKRLKKDIAAETKIATPPVERKFSRFGVMSDQLNISTQRLSFITKETTKIISLESLISDEKILNERCGICKLTFNQGKLAIFCPQCETLFHGDHLTN